ncbi:amino acid permease [Muriicola sp.]|uniref:amino acid permease n=3 Tax=Muriicola sp. TaxID=2020856 RepID=UPI0035617BE8
MSSKPSKGKLGIWMATSLVIGNMIGAGVFMMPAALAEYGGISILGWLASSIGAILLALVFSRLSKMVRDNNGGPYAFARHGFGDYVGFMVAWGYWIAVWTAVAALSIAFVSAMSIFFPVFNQEPVVALMTGLSAIWFLSWVNSRGVRSSGKMQVLTTILKLSPILVIILGGFFFFNADNFIPFNASDTSSFNAIAITGTMTLYAFLGLECATIPADNVKDPVKTIPRATLLGTLITTAVYILGTVVVMGLVPLDKLTNSPAPFADAMKVMTGETGSYIVAGGAAIAAFGALNGWILIQSQLARAISHDGLFPRIFKKENSNGVPVWGIVIGSALSSLVMLMNYTEGLVEQFKFIILLSTLCTLVPYLFSAAAYVAISLEGKKSKKPGTGIFILGGLTFLYAMWAIFGAGEEAVFWGFILLLAGTPFYVWLKWKNNLQNR